ncbi:hypothetical protein AWENTII_010959 [Aspergillus wentii]
MAAEFANHVFDYLIVGGGTAGLAVAARLSQLPYLTVGVIEAGPAALDDPAINIPGRYGETIGSRYDWQFETVSQSGLQGRSLSWPRGKVLGGTSALNFMAWNRGNREDYDAWEELGNEGWGPFFKQSEAFHPPDASHQEQFRSYYDAVAHGSDGPIQTSHIREYGPAHQFWHQTLNNLSVDTSKDSLSGSNTGAWNLIATIDPKTQSRSYAANAYYLPFSQRPNLFVLTEATVEEILLEKEEDEWVARGARVVCDGEEFTVNVSREVILSAGSVQSPQLLELSGIGNRDVLEAAGIPVKLHNPNVGENLQEHMMTATIFEILPSIATRDDLQTDSALAEAANTEYENSQTGPLTVLACSVSYSPLSQFTSPEELSTLHSRAESIAKESGLPRDTILARQFQPNTKLGQVEFLFDVGNWSPFFKSEPGKKYATMLQMLQYPFSKGSIHIPPRTGDRRISVNDKPIIDPRYYLGDGKIDFDIMKMAQRFTDRICSTEPLSSIILSRVFPPVAEGVEDEFDEYVRNYTITDWHPVGTCAMGGSTGEKTGVVDERLRVYGVRGLRVIDASIMPLQVSAHIQATVYAIAEKGAAMILEDA